MGGQSDNSSSSDRISAMEETLSFSDCSALSLSLNVADCWNFMLVLMLRSFSKANSSLPECLPSVKLQDEPSAKSAVPSNALLFSALLLHLFSSKAPNGGSRKVDCALSAASFSFSPLAALG